MASNVIPLPLTRHYPRSNLAYMNKASILDFRKRHDALNLAVDNVVSRSFVTLLFYQQLAFNTGLLLCGLHSQQDGDNSDHKPPA